MQLNFMDILFGPCSMNCTLALLSAFNAHNVPCGKPNTFLYLLTLVVTLRCRRSVKSCVSTKAVANGPFVETDGSLHTNLCGQQTTAIYWTCGHGDIHTDSRTGGDKDGN